MGDDVVQRKSASKLRNDITDNQDDDSIGEADNTNNNEELSGGSRGGWVKSQDAKNGGW